MLVMQWQWDISLETERPRGTVETREPWIEKENLPVVRHLYVDWI